MATIKQQIKEHKQRPHMEGIFFDVLQKSNPSATIVDVLFFPDLVNLQPLVIL
jgi:hypothetical protein